MKNFFKFIDVVMTYKHTYIQILAKKMYFIFKCLQIEN